MNYDSLHTWNINKNCIRIELMEFNRMDYLHRSNVAGPNTPSITHLSDSKICTQVCQTCDHHLNQPLSKNNRTDSK